jgi:hypothetical protein
MPAQDSTEASLAQLKELKEKGLVDDSVYKNVTEAVLMKKFNGSDNLSMNAHRVMSSLHDSAKHTAKQQDFEQKPQVWVSYKVESLGDVDCLHPLFNAHFKLFCQWEDMRLIGVTNEQKDAIGTDVTDQIVPPAHSRFREGWPHWLYNPDVQIINGRDLVCTYYEIKVTNVKTGAVKWTK